MRVITDRGLGQQLISSVLTTAALRHADREALYCSGTGRRFTFRELNERSNRLAQSFSARGFRKGAVIGFLCPNRAEIVEIYFALAKTGIIGLPLNYRLAASEMAALLAAMGATGLVCDARFAGVLELLRRDVPALGEVIWIGNSPPAAVSRTSSLRTFSRAVLIGSISLAAACSSLVAARKFAILQSLTSAPVVSSQSRVRSASRAHTP